MYLNIQSMIDQNNEYQSSNSNNEKNVLVLGHPGAGYAGYIKEINGTKKMVKWDGTILEKSPN